MRVKTIARSEAQYGERESSADASQLRRNLDPRLHPQSAALEATRAGRAARLGRLNAKPLVAALGGGGGGNAGGHADSILALAVSPTELSTVLSADAQGVVILWDIARREAIRRYVHPSGRVAGSNRWDERMLRCGARTGTGIGCAQEMFFWTLCD